MHLSLNVSAGTSIPVSKCIPHALKYCGTAFISAYLCTGYKEVIIRFLEDYETL